MPLEVIKAHKCNCLRSWKELEFGSVQALKDGSLALSHTCDEAPDEECVHVLSPKVTALIKKALKV